MTKKRRIGRMTPDSRYYRNTRGVEAFLYISLADDGEFGLTILFVRNGSKGKSQLLDDSASAQEIADVLSEILSR